MPEKIPQTAQPKEIGERIRRARRARELTQEELGEKIGVTKATINRYESGVIKSFARSQIELIAKALNVSPAYILGWDEEDPDIAAAYIQSLNKITSSSIQFLPNPRLYAQRSSLADTKVDDLQNLEVKPELAFEEITDRLLDKMKQNDPIAYETYKIACTLSMKAKNKLLTYAYELEESENQ